MVCEDFESAIPERSAVRAEIWLCAGEIHIWCFRYEKEWQRARGRMMVVNLPHQTRAPGCSPAY